MVEVAVRPVIGMDALDQAGIDKIMHCDKLIATPVNLGSTELISVDALVSLVEGIAGLKLKRSYDLTAPKGVAGRNSDNTRLREVLQWEPTISLEDGLERTYHWIANELEKSAAPMQAGVLT